MSYHPRKLKKTSRSNKKIFTQEVIREENDELKTLIVTQGMLIRYLLTAFSIFMFTMIIIFPNSIFDSLWPEGMFFFRDMVSWGFLSAVVTFLPIPGVSVADVRLLSIVVNSLTDNWYIITVVLFLISFDTLFSIMGYKFSSTLKAIFTPKSRKSKTGDKEEKKASERLKKYGNIGMFLGAATPLPFTLFVYTAGALKLNFKGFVFAVFMGRLLKYAGLVIPLRLFGFDLFEWFNGVFSSMLTSIF